MSYDVLADLCAWLSARLGVPCSTSVPARRPAEVDTVERTGGQPSLGRDDPNLAVRGWSGTEAGANTRRSSRAGRACPWSAARR